MSIRKLVKLGTGVQWELPLETAAVTHSSINRQRNGVASPSKVTYICSGLYVAQAQHFCLDYFGLSYDFVMIGASQ